MSKVDDAPGDAGGGGVSTEYGPHALTRHHVPRCVGNRVVLHSPSV